MEKIMYGPQMRITNIENLPSGTGSRYLEVMKPHSDDLPYVAICWRRKLPAKAIAGRLVVEFPSR